ncbi:MAG: carboxymuconolactone decarboxylase family protein [Dehalococcoidia bacterium]|nr:carboxymuconolactone decarboxylase family protein [Dehalococcoidia bacterium]
MESQIELSDKIRSYAWKLPEEWPEEVAKHMAFFTAVYEDGALSSKVKRLIALGIAIRAGCTGCILAQTRRAVEAGASREEVLEVIAVTAAMGGTPSMAWSWRVIQLLDELSSI